MSHPHPFKEAEADAPGPVLNCTVKRPWTPAIKQVFPLIQWLHPDAVPMLHTGPRERLIYKCPNCNTWDVLKEMPSHDQSLDARPVRITRSP